MFEHLPTLRILEQQRATGSSSLFLTPLQAQVLANATDSSLLGARPILRATEGTGYYTPEKGMRGVWGGRERERERVRDCVSRERTRTKEKDRERGCASEREREKEREGERERESER